MAELHPDKVILEGHTGYFDLEAFVRAEHCSIVAESSVFNHIRTRWEGPKKDQRHQFQNSWLNVLWRGQLLDVILITWSEGCYRSRHHWVVASSRELAEGFFAEVCEWSSEVRGEILVFKDGDWEKNEELYDSIKAATFANVILPASLKEQVQNDFAQFFDSRELYEKYGIPWKRGALFIGPPGNGKTHTVKALINQLSRPCLYVKGFKSEYATEQENMGLVFARARMASPCLLVLEDLDSMIDDENRSFFLNELDGFESNTGLLVLATTNHADKLDPAILDRPSRFDRKYYFNLPGPEERRAYVVAWNEKTLDDTSKSASVDGQHQTLRLSDEVIEKLVTQTENFSFAYLKELFLSTTMQWMSTYTTARNDGGTNSFVSQHSMDEVILEQAAVLRTQMTSSSASGSEELSGNFKRVAPRLRQALQKLFANISFERSS